VTVGWVLYSISSPLRNLCSFEKNPNARDGKKDHFFDYKTVLKAVEESGQLGGYYTTAFERGAANTDEEMQTVAA
jgi:hypothetical protein